MDSHLFTFVATGQMAVFTRPEFRVDRLTYECPTHASLVGILDGFLSNSKVQWNVEECQILRPITYTSFLRNEVAFDRSSNKTKIHIQQSLQRMTTALHDVAYRFKARIDLTQHGHEIYQNDGGSQAAIWKYEKMARKAFRHGRCKGDHPYFGMREFFADVFLISSGPNEDSEIDDFGDPIDLDYDIGFMHYISDKYATPKPISYFHDAQIRNGIIKYPTREQVINQGVFIQ